MRMNSTIDCDLLVVGGGINGAGIARDAAGRGLSVVLCERDDLAAHTSSASTKLIHGGLRYLESRDFGLVRKALIEREVLMRSAPHIIWPLRFVMPHDAGQRPAWMVRAGLMVYDRLAPRKLLPGSRAANLLQHVAGIPLRPQFSKGYIYSDGWVDDARLVVLNAMDAAEAGATILTRTACDAAQRSGDRWQATLRGAAGVMTVVRARAMVNATGPWAARFLHDASGADQPLRLVKGSHIVVRRKFNHPYAYVFQHPDRRIVFAIPYEQEFTLIGTTDIDYDGDPGQVTISDEEISYLCGLVNRYFTSQTTPDDVVWTYSGVRPRVEESGKRASAVTRDYQLRLDSEGPPLLSVFGGKITTFRKLADEALDLLGPLLGKSGGAWTAEACLPGGDLYGPAPSPRSVLEFDDYVRMQKQAYHWAPPALIERYARAYGTRMHRLLADCGKMDDLGRQVLPGLFEAELYYLMRHEWARTAEDILWRRSKLGLHLPRDAATTLDAWITAAPVPELAVSR
jgi:glycerol-3-phosphate dehydrogenase